MGDLPRVLSIPPGVPFLPKLAEAFLDGRLVPGFRFDGDPLSLADTTFYVPTRRAARELRSVFVDRMGGCSAILPVIRPLGEFDEDAASFAEESAVTLDLAPPIAALDRILLLAPLVRAWKSRIPAHVAARYEEGVVVPASASDAIWLARDLAALMDEIETEEADWRRLESVVPADLAGWWQVTLDFLRIVTAQWPEILAEIGRSNPATHRNALISAEADRLGRCPPQGPVIAAGSTGTNPATAMLLAAISRLPKGAVVLPGLDLLLDERSWDAIDGYRSPSAFGHPQFGMKKLLSVIGIERADVEEIAIPQGVLQSRRAMISEALRPAETTDAWAEAAAIDGHALAGISLVEAANEREEALTIAVALRHAIMREGSTAALVTPDRDLARRVAAELRRFGIVADDSGGSLLSRSLPAILLSLLLEAVFRVGDPVPIVGLLKHPLLRLGMRREKVRSAAEAIELVALRGGTGRPDLAGLSDLFEERLTAMRKSSRPPYWAARISDTALIEARDVLAELQRAIAPLAALRDETSLQIGHVAHASVEALEALAREETGAVAELYRGDAGQVFADFLRKLISAQSALEFEAREWPDILAALMATEVVKPPAGADPRIAIWGPLEARLQSVDTLVLGGLNEGSWPHIPASDRFMSRLMKGELALEPPERRIGLAAHDFMMAMGAPEVVLTRAARSGDAPAIASRWLQRLLTCAGDVAEDMRLRGQVLIEWARALDTASKVDFAPRPRPVPPLEARPRQFSVTEIETLRRDPYAVYAKRILRLLPLDPLIRDPGTAERGTLFHEILQRYTQSGVDPLSDEAFSALMTIGRQAFEELALPADVEAVWWPRFVRTAHHFIGWERGRAEGIVSRHAEARAAAWPVGKGSKTLSGYADRIDIRAGGKADILDYKTGSSPSKAQAHTLLSPQLALEAALLERGAFAPLVAGAGELAYVRLKANGEVKEESILAHNRQEKTAGELASEAWARLENLLAFYDDPAAGYLSRALPFREGDTSGDYDHLARVLEWSAGGDEDGGGEAP